MLYKSSKEEPNIVPRITRVKYINLEVLTLQTSRGKYSKANHQYAECETCELAISYRILIDAMSTLAMGSKIAALYESATDIIPP